MGIGCASTRSTWLAAAVSSTIPTPAARAVFIVRAMKSVPIGWITARRACGMITKRRDCPNVRPRARAASLWPRATVFIPARIASAMNAASYTAIVRAAVVKRSAWRPTSGRAKMERTSRASSGMFWSVSTYTVPTPRRMGTGLTLRIATSIPAVSAPTKPSSVRAIVVSMPLSNCGRYCRRTFIASRSRERLGKLRARAAPSGRGNRRDAALARMVKGGLGSRSGADRRRRRRVAGDDRADRFLPHLGPDAIGVDLLEPAVDELLHRCVAELEADAVRLRSDGVRVNREIGVGDGVAEEDSLVLDVRDPAALLESLDALGIGVEGDDVCGRRSGLDGSDCRRVGARDDGLSVERGQRGELRLARSRRDDEARGEVGAGEVDLGRALR